MKTAIKREINALNRISQNVINASVNKFDLIPFVYAGPRTADGRRVVYIDVLAWYAAKSGQPGLMYGKICSSGLPFIRGIPVRSGSVSGGIFAASWVITTGLDLAVTGVNFLITPAAWWNPNYSRRLRYD